MTKTLLLSAAAAALLFTGPAQAGDINEKIQYVCDETVLSCDDDNSDSTKDLNGRVGQAAALAAAADTRIGKTGERLNLDLNWTANEFGTGGSVGGGAFFHVPELADGFYVGLRGAHSTDGAGSLIGVGVTYSLSPF